MKVEIVQPTTSNSRSFHVVMGGAYHRVAQRKYNGFVASIRDIHDIHDL